MRNFLYPLLLTLLIFAALAPNANAATPLTFYVAPSGQDTWSGKKTPNKAHTDGPFATVGRARDAIRALKEKNRLPKGGVRVLIAGGTYELKELLTLDARDAGTADAPIEYAAQKGQTVRLIGGRRLSGWKPVTDAALLARLEPAARAHVLQADLSAMGLRDLPGVSANGYWGQSEPGVEVFQTTPQTLARWPNNAETVRMATVANGTPDPNTPGLFTAKEGKFTYDGDRPKRWKNEAEIWLHGYWSLDWADQRQKVTNLDTDKREITLSKPDHEFGYRSKQYYYAFNLFSEIDEPGEWFLDHKTNVLYFWPKAPLETEPAYLSVLPNLVTMDKAAYVTLRGLTLEMATGSAVTASGADNVRIAACTIRNVGSWAVRMSDSKNSGVYGCDITNTGEGGIYLQGGDRKTLTPGNLTADNNHIYHWSRWNPVYKPAVQADGVGNIIRHNLIHDAPHMAIGFSGNDNIIEYNEIHGVCYNTNDAGAIYTGRNWSMRGNIIRFNYLHDLYGRENRGCMGVYLDDNFSSAQIFGNVFKRVPRTVFLGGGRDNKVENNIFMDCEPAVNVDARGLGWRANGRGELTKSLEEMPYRDALWSRRYPELLTLLTDDPMAPKGVVITRNVAVGGAWSNITTEAKPYVIEKDNFISGDPAIVGEPFADSARNNFALLPNSSLLKAGFVPIPFDKIGLYPGAERASWPVTSTVRPKPETPKP